MFKINRILTGRESRVRRILIVTGLILLTPSVIYLLLGMTGLVPTDFLAIGSNSGLRSIASVAVVGCLLTAIGYWEE